MPLARASPNSQTEVTKNRQPVCKFGDTSARGKQSSSTRSSTERYGAVYGAVRSGSRMEGSRNNRQPVRKWRGAAATGNRFANGGEPQQQAISLNIWGRTRNRQPVRKWRGAAATGNRFANGGVPQPQATGPQTTTTLSVSVSVSVSVICICICICNM